MGTSLKCLTFVSITLEVFLKYVDDVNLAMRIIPKEITWSEDGHLTWSEAQMEQDVTDNTLADDARTMLLVCELVDSITLGVKFTIDLPSDHTNGRTPMLDVLVWF